MHIRSTVKAIIIHNDKILLNRCTDNKNGSYYTLPGGGQNKYESLHEALVRECLEETGYLISPVKFIALCEEICEDLTLREQSPEYAHKMHHVFVCELCSDMRTTPTELDSMQIESEWVAIDCINSIRLLPKYLEDNILKMLNSGAPTFCSTEHIPFNHG